MTDSSVDTYQSLSELLNKRMGEDCTPYTWGRMIYKVTNCGPSTNFIVGETKEHPAKVKVFFDENNVLTLWSIDKEGLEWPLWTLTCNFLGFDPDTRQLLAKKHYKSLADFKLMLDQYLFQSSPKIYKYTYNITPHEITITIKLPVNSVQVINYQDEIAVTRNWTGGCKSISVGSIIEGSEVEVELRELAFPFSSTELECLLKAIDDEASFYWERDNSHYYKVYFNNDIHYLQDIWGEYKWNDKDELPTDIIEQNASAFPHPESR